MTPDTDTGVKLELEALERRVAKAIRILSDSRLHECTRIVEARDVLIYGGPEDAAS
ncbi:MAG: hypothetical protein KA105_02495 [Caulobacter sp.]|nr:hypothetical protein [Caulobacter sp.]